MGACGSRPKTLENDAPMEIPTVEKTPVTTSEVIPAEASATIEVIHVYSFLFYDNFIR